MSDETARAILAYTRSVVDYLGAIVIGVMIAGGMVLLPQLESGQPINWTPVFAAALASLLTALRAMQLSRLGGNEPFTPAQLKQVLAGLEKRLKAEKS